MILKTSSQDYGPTLFKFYTSWLDKKEIDKVVTEAVNKVVLDPGDVADSRLLKKLKQVKMDLKTWNRKNKEESNNKIEALEETCYNFELKAELGLLCDSEYDEWAEAKSKWNQLENEKTHDSRQKSRIKWVIDGDENSSFFIGCVKHILLGIV